MDNILLVDDNEEVLETLKDGLALYKSQFRIIAAADGMEAVKLLNEKNISLVLTDLVMPGIGGLELIAYMTRNFSTLPCIVMTRLDGAQLKDGFSWQGVLRCIEKPFEIREIGAAIIEGLDLLDEGLTRRGIAVSSFLPLVEIDGSTCFLKINSAAAGKGLFYFENGILFDASCGNLKADEAAIEMLTWEGVEITFLAVPLKKYERRIFSVLNTLIAEARRSIERTVGYGQRADSLQKNPRKEVFIAPETTQRNNDIIHEEICADDLVEEEFFVEIKPGSKEFFEKKLCAFKDFEGFGSLCVFSPGGEIIASQYANQYDGSIEFELVGDWVFDIIRKTRKCFKCLGLGQPDIMDIKTDKGEHFLIQEYAEGKIQYVVVIVCFGGAETKKFKEQLSLIGPELAQHIKIR